MYTWVLPWGSPSSFSFRGRPILMCPCGRAHPHIHPLTWLNLFTQVLSLDFTTVCRQMVIHDVCGNAMKRLTTIHDIWHIGRRLLLLYHMKNHKLWPRRIHTPALIYILTKMREAPVSAMYYMCSQCHYASPTHPTTTPSVRPTPLVSVSPTSKSYYHRVWIIFVWYIVCY